MTVFRNRMPLVIWIFMAIWMAFLIAMTYVTARDGPPPGYAPATIHAVLACFWIAGIGVCGWACTQRLLRVVVADSGALDITWRSPVWVERRRVEAADVPPAIVVDGKDSDGDPYFKCCVALADGVTLDLAESHSRPDVEAAAARFNAVAGRRRGVSPSPMSPHS